MLVIRQEQINQMVKGTDEEFVEYVTRHMKSEGHEIIEERDEETLRTMVRGGIRRSESHGFSRPEDIVGFVSIMFKISPNFDEEEEIQRILDNENLTPEARLEFVWSEAVPAEVWEEAEKNADEDSWFDEKFLNAEQAEPDVKTE